MARVIPTTEPTVLVAGDTWDWTKSLADYPASTWTLSYVLINSTDKITIAASADGDTHSVDVAAATTAAYDAGTYKWQSYVSDGTDRYLVGEGTITVKANYNAATTYDARSHVKTTLDALDAMIEGKASVDQAAMSIAGRSLSRYSPDELIRWWKHYKSLYRQELDAEQVAMGLGSPNVVRVRF